MPAARDGGGYVKHPTRGPDVFQAKLEHREKSVDSPIRINLEPREISSQIERASLILDQARAKRIDRTSREHTGGHQDFVRNFY